MTTTPSSPVATAAAAGILKAANRQQKKKINVKFGHDEDVVVIGYGGVEFFDGDVDDESDGVTGDDEDDFTYTDEDRRVIYHFIFLKYSKWRTIINLLFNGLCFEYYHMRVQLFEY